MNYALIKQINDAHKYYQLEETHFLSKIREQVDAIHGFRDAFYRKRPPKAPATQIEEQNIKDILLCLFVWPIGLAQKRKHKKNKLEIERQLNEKFVAEMRAYDEFCEEILRYIKHANSLILQIDKKREEFERTYGSVVSFLPPAYRSFGYVKRLGEYIRNGRADNLKEAINLMIADMQREEDQENQKIMFESQQELMRKHHKEHMEIQNKILESQEETRKDMRYYAEGIRTDLKYLR